MKDTLEYSISRYSFLKEGFRNREFSPFELIKELLQRIQDDKSGAFLHVCEERAIRQSRECDVILAREGTASFKRFPLLGMPIGIKDALTVDGTPTTAGSKMLQNYVAPYTATAVKRLEKAGAIVIGKLNMDEFAMGSSNENSAFGPVLHPTHPDRVPGGSSGGSAVAVARGLCTASLGSDTGGSIRLPASFCGVAGLKPTYGRVSRFGLIAYASSLDQVGPLAQTTEDCARILEVMAGVDVKDGTSSQTPISTWSSFLSGDEDWGRLRIGVPEEYFSSAVAPEVAEAVEKAIQWYEKKGAKRVPIRLPHTAYAVATYYLVAMSEASSNLERMDGIRFGISQALQDSNLDLESLYLENRKHFGPEVKRRILLGTFALSAGYAEDYYQRACRVRRKIQDDFTEAFKAVDFIVSPVSPVTAFKRGEKIKDPLQMYLADVFTLSASLAGIPAMSIPCGKDKDGLSIGLQLMAPAFQEGRLLRWAHQFETRREP